MSVHSFAQSHLEKYGWKKGKGLGKTESGITDAIKPKLKFDTAGVGHDAGEQFTFHWWDHVFNKAAKNIVVENHEDGVQVKQKGTNDNLISNKRSSGLKTSKPLMYGSFVKSGTLKPDGKISQDDSSSSDEEDEVPESYEGNDEKLFKACGGRTAHKGARHGLLLTGKLKRIQEQDRLHGNSGVHVKVEEDRSERKNEYEMKVEERKTFERNAAVEGDMYEETVQKVKKSKKKRRKHEDTSCSGTDKYRDIGSPGIGENRNACDKEKEIWSSTKKCKKSKKKRTRDFREHLETSDEADSQDVRENGESHLEKKMSEIAEETCCKMAKKNKKSKQRKKNKDCEELLHTDVENFANGDSSCAKIRVDNGDCDVIRSSQGQRGKKKKHKKRKNLVDIEVEGKESIVADSGMHGKNEELDCNAENQTVEKGPKKKKNKTIIAGQQY